MREVNHAIKTQETNKLKQENQRRGSMSGVCAHMSAHAPPTHTTTPTIITTINTSIITNDNNQMTGTTITDISQYQ